MAMKRLIDWCVPKKALRWFDLHQVPEPPGGYAWYIVPAEHRPATWAEGRNGQVLIVTRWTRHLAEFPPPPPPSSARARGEG